MRHDTQLAPWLSVSGAVPLLAVVSAELAPGGATLAPPAPAAPALTLADACTSSDDEYAVLSGSGFTPRAEIELRVHGRVYGRPVADASGAFAEWSLRVDAEAGWEEPAVARVRIEAREVEAPARRADVRQLMATTAVSVTPSKGPAATVARWRATGLAAAVAAGGRGRSVYAHWLRNGRYVATTRFGRMTGPCGVLRQLHPLLPSRISRPGTWEVRIVNRRNFDRDRGGYAATTFTVTPGRPFRTRTAGHALPGDVKSADDGVRR